MAWGGSTGVGIIAVAVNDGKRNGMTNSHEFGWTDFGDRRQCEHEHEHTPRTSQCTLTDVRHACTPSASNLLNYFIT